MQHRDITKIETNGKEIYLIGTAHVSRASVELVRNTIREIKPDTVAVELCKGRYESLTNPEVWKKADIFTVIKEGKAYLLMAQLILSSFQKRISKHLEIKPGEEMLTAIREAEDSKADLVLADRKIKITMKRAWSKLGFWSMVKVFAYMIGSLFTHPEISEEEIEGLKSADALAAMMSDVSKNMPEISKAIIDERDMYLAEKIRSAPGRTIVAVVGAGHVAGIKKYINMPIDMATLETIPPPSLLPKIIGWSIPLIVIGLIIYGFASSGAQTGVDMILKWVIPNGAFAGLGAIAALAHPLTIAAAIASAPLTSLNPFIAAGWVAGLVEALIRKPTVADFENLGDDITTLRGLWKNGVTRILLVIALTNLGSMIGTAIGVPLVASVL
ncbi:MAG: TraB/GumN family protein [Candidatus Dadabacteria bacterium]|nr:MAG: TraB/GumN family protein [Candidatus Dadabacteria bacterium]